MNIGKYFTINEFVVSEYAERNGIANTPSDYVINNLQKLCNNILDPLREHLGKPIIITSGYRSAELNKAIGGSPTSQHIVGQAADIIVPSIPIDDLFHTIIDSGLPYDQLINEFHQWIHVSYTDMPRKQKLLALRINGKTGYFQIS
jgi:hypothetical protein